MASGVLFLLVLIVAMNISNDHVSIPKYCQPKFSLSFLQDQGGQFLCGLSTFLWSEKAHVRCRFFIAFSLFFSLYIYICIYVHLYGLEAFHWLIYFPLIYSLVILLRSFSFSMPCALRSFRFLSFPIISQVKVSTLSIVIQYQCLPNCSGCAMPDEWVVVADCSQFGQHWRN